MEKSNKPVKEKILSASRIKTLETCSWSYWCNYHLRVPQKQNEGALRGTVCHLAFERSGCLADFVVALPRLEVGAKPQAPGSWSQLPALWVWVMRLTKSLASTSAGSTRQSCLRRYSLREVRTTSLCLVFSWSKCLFFFSVLCGLERNQPLHFGLLCVWKEPLRLLS